jgi:hypothetical protein
VEGIEARIASIVTGKKALFDGVFDGTSDEVRFEGGSSFIASLQKTVVPDIAPQADGDEDAAEHAADSGDRVLPERDGRIDLLAGVSLQKLADGRLVLEAKPEVAGALAAMLEGLVSMLRQQAGS